MNSLKYVGPVIDSDTMCPSVKLVKNDEMYKIGKFSIKITAELLKV